MLILLISGDSLVLMLVSLSCTRFPVTFDFCPNFLVTPVSQIKFCDHIISSFTCILVLTAAIVLVSVGEGRSSGNENVSHGTIFLAVRKMKLGDFL